jgi:hypothetical protein
VCAIPKKEQNISNPISICTVACYQQKQEAFQKIKEEGENNPQAALQSRTN